ncbi:MAG: 50S ribosomal protein L22 [Verrucomicrobiaceae bacterium]|nr:MAG: 50S ribosomal protein L22 [Verrucomicrobiaceae bacterium]
MDVKAISKYVRISPLKARDVAREIQGLPVSAALSLLNFTPKKAAVLFTKTLKSAVANAEHNFSLDANNLIVKSAVANLGPVHKRMKPLAKGSSAAIRKPMSHLQVIVSDEKPQPKKKDKAAKKPAAAATAAAE